MRRKLLTIATLLTAFASIVFAGSAGLPQVAVPTTSVEQSVAPASQRAKSDKYVDMKSDGGRQTEYGGRKIIIAVGNFAAHHNGAVITCDSTVRYSDSHIECFGNVLINKGTTYIYGDRAEYDGELNEARIYSNIVKVLDRGTTLYTYNFKFNTKTNIGEFSGGGVVYDGATQLEADRGFYYADSKDIVCVGAVEMRDDTYEMSGDSVVYNMETNRANFFRHTNIWNPEKGEYLYADRGIVDSDNDHYKLTENGYLLTPDQELWSDTLDYYRERGYALLRNNIQIDDSKQKLLAFGDWGEYWKEPGNVLLTRNPSIINYDMEQGDSLFLRSDSMFLYTKDPVAERLAREAEKRMADSLQQIKAAAMASIGSKAEANNAATEGEESASAVDAERLARIAALRSQARKGGETPNGNAAASSNGVVSGATNKGEQVVSGSDSLQSATDSMRVDSLATDSARVDSLKNPLDTLTAAQRKALAREARKAQLKAQRDSIKQERDSIKKVKAELLRKKLDSIGEIRLQKRVAFQRKLDRADSLRKVREKERADKRLRRIVLRRERRGIKTLPVHDSILLRVNDSILAHEMQWDSLARRMVDSLLLIYFPKAKVDTLAVDTMAVDSTYRMILAYRNVRMYRSDFQMVCDSLATTSIDSIIHLHINPVLWNENNQVTSDIMHIHTDSGRITRAEFEGKPLTVAEIDTTYYNQVAGKAMVAYFKDNQIYRNDVDGNVQTIFFQEEEDTKEVSMMVYVESATMSSYIENRELVGITYRGNPTYTFFPIDKIPETQPMRLPTFKWEAHRRPTRDSVFMRRIRPSEREVKEGERRPQFYISKSMERRKMRLLNLKTWSDRTDTLSLETIEWVESVK